MKTSREDLIVTALRLFLTKGYERTSMMDLARASGLSKGAFHHYFPRKDDLKAACVAHFFGDFLPSAEVDATMPLADLAQALAQSHAGALIRLREHQIPLAAFQAFLWDQLRQDTRPLHDQLAATRARLCDRLQQEKGLAATEARRSAQLLLAVIEGTGTLLCLAPDPTPQEIETAFQSAVETVLTRL